MKTTSSFHMPHRASTYRAVGSLAILLFAIGPAREAAALPLVYEGFRYVPGKTLPTMSGGFGWAAGTWTGSGQMVDTPPTLSYPTGLPSAGDALLNPAAGEAFRNFWMPLNNAGSDLWISFQEETAAAAGGASVVIFPLSGSDIQVDKNGLGAITLNGNAAGFSAGVGQVDFFLVQVAKFSGGVTVVNLYLNPGAVFGPPSATFSTTMVFLANEFYFRTDPLQWLDEIRVGTTSQDVSQASAQGASGGSIAQFFRVSGPTATTITSFGADGTLVFSNAMVGATYTIQTASSLASGSPAAGGTSWVDDHQIVASNNVVSDSELIMAIPLWRLMTDIPGGTFTMGDTLDGLLDARPTNVTVSEFYMDTYPVQYGSWRSIYTWAKIQGYGFTFGGSGKKANHPVQTVDWYDCVKWCNARSQKDGLTPVYCLDAGFTQVYTSGETDAVFVNWAANGYRLPTEAEGERAARGGLIGQRFPWGNTISESQANYLGNSSLFAYDLGPVGYNATGLIGGLPYTSPVGSFAPNGYGLYDMAGNVLEWCQDWYGTLYGQPTTSNPTGPAIGSYRVMRGGSWDNNAGYARCAYRDDVESEPYQAYFYLGFRCVRGH